MKKNTVFITGATGLLGKIYTEKFLENGYCVIFTSSNQKNIQEMYHTFSTQKDSGNLFGVFTDLMSDLSIKEIMQFLVENDLRPNYLVNNARSIKYLSLEDDGMPSKENWMNEYYLDVVIPCQLSMAFLEMDCNALKAIVNIASMYGMIPPNPFLYDNPKKESVIHYGVCKAAMIQLTKDLAVRFAPYNVRVNSIAYGGVEGRTNDEFKKRYAQLCPMKRMLRKEDIFGPVEYLCSDKSSGMTGHNLVVDGGFSAW